MSGIEPLIIGGLVGGGLQLAQASQRNSSIRKQAGNTEAAAAEQARQLAERRAQSIEENRREAAALRGRLLASTAERGIGFAGSSFDALDNSILSSLTRANEATETNYRNARENIRLGTQSTLDQLFAQYQSPVLAGLSGSLQGSLTGLQLYDGYTRLNPPKPKVDRFPYGS